VFTNRDDKQDALVRLPAAALVAAEALRAPPGFGPDAPAAPKSDDRVPIFWRIFGGTILSIAALVCITVYQQFTNGINELRKELNTQNEARLDLVKKEELSTRLAPLWTSVKDAQAAQAEINALKERCVMLQEQVKAGENERKLLNGEVQQLRERLVHMEGRMEARPPTKD
jgi:hypothetical protein